MLIVNIISRVFCAAALIIAVLAAFRLLKERFSKTIKTVASVVNKQTYMSEVIGKERAPHSERRYVLSFMSGGKRLDFYVSAAMYDNCHIGDKGNITYKGSTLLNFEV